MNYAEALYQALKPADPKEQCDNLRRIMDEENRKHAETFMKLPAPEQPHAVRDSAGGVQWVKP